MSTSSIACPHCGSSLSFSMELAAGTAVNCLICMRTFVTQAKYVPPPPPTAALAPPIPAAKPAPAKPTPPAEKPRPVPQAAPTPAPAPQAAPKRSAPAPMPSQAGGGCASTIVVAGLLLLIGGGGGVVAWKYYEDSTKPSDDKGNPPIALNQGKKNPTDGPEEKSPKEKDSNADPEKKATGSTKKDPGAFDAADEERRKAEEAKQKLIRKTPTVIPVKDPEFVPITPVEPVLPFGLSQPTINVAIDKGVGFLKAAGDPRKFRGEFGDYVVGYAALTGLTLLECKVPANNETIQRCLAVVRERINDNTRIYEMAPSVLFLDRLGDPRDRVLIQGLALRILSAQKEGGVWSYNTEPLDGGEMYQLFGYLHSHNPPADLESLKAVQSIPPHPRANDAFASLSANLIRGGVPNPLDPNPPLDLRRFNVFGTVKGKVKPIAPQALKPTLQPLPIVQNQGKKKGQFGKAQVGQWDSSNTQFALMALWAARRHGVPVDQAVRAAFQHAETAQKSDGGWSYSDNDGSTPSMTCVGLLLAAMGHAVDPVIIGPDPKDPTKNRTRPALEDAKVQAGLLALSHGIGTPAFQEKKEFKAPNLYFLWSVERVALLYDLKRIEGKDWYGWGAQNLLNTQDANGSWATNTEYPGSTSVINTCFALLFLKRSNLVPDLTESLKLQTAIRGR